MEQTFDYAIIEITHRLNVNRPIDHEVTILDKVIRTGLEHKWNISGTKCWTEFQIIYKDAENKVQCGKYSIKDCRFNIKKIGDAQISL